MSSPDMREGSMSINFPSQDSRGRLRFTERLEGMLPGLTIIVLGYAGALAAKLNGVIGVKEAALAMGAAGTIGLAAMLVGLTRYRKNHN